ncbi:MAG: cell wall-binding repeat-containing protein, partial [Finegoldia magna]|nr:cell wall-binding repeat-containing protein [Finegoldia magna]
MKLDKKKIMALFLTGIMTTSMIPVGSLANNENDFSKSKFEQNLNEKTTKNKPDAVSNSTNKEDKSQDGNENPSTHEDNHTEKVNEKTITVDELFKGQKGTKEDPYTISDKDQLIKFAYSLSKTQDYKDKYVELSSDIELNNDWVPVGLGEYAFNGHFDGKNHKINGLKIGSKDNLHKDPSEKDKKIVFYGLFGVLGANSYIENLKIDVDFNLISDSALYVGALAGYANGSTINNIEVTGKLIGKTTHPKTNIFVGGVISNGIRQKIVNSKSDIDIRVESDGGLAEGGGIMALSNRGLVFNCYSKGNISANANRVTKEGSTALGGICGVNAGTISNCYSTNDIISDCYTGFIGAITGWVTGIGLTFQSYYDKDSVLITDNATKNKNIIKPSVPIGWMVKGSGVSDEGMAYEGSVSMDLKGMTKSEMSSSLANILNSNLKKSRINLKKGSRSKDYWKKDENLAENIFEWTNSSDFPVFSDKKTSVVYDINTENLIKQLQMNSKEGINEGDFYGRSKDKSLVVKVKFDKKGDIIDIKTLEGRVTKEEIDKIIKKKEKISDIKNNKLKEALLKAVEKSKINDITDYSKLNYNIFEKGKGTKDDPFIIDNENQFLDFARSVNEEENYADKYVKLNRDIKLTKEWIVVGSQGKHPFKGDFNGNNHTISNMKIGSEKTPRQYRFAALFAVIDGGKVYNLNIKDFEIYNTILSEDRVFVGAVAGGIQNGAFIDNVNVNGKIHSKSMRTQQYIGAIAGQSLKSSIINSSAEIQIDAKGESKDIYAGGLVGINAFGALFNSYSKGNITADSLLNKVSIGGLCGYQSGVIFNNYSSVNLNSTSPTTDVGELAGRSTGTGKNFDNFYSKNSLVKITGKSKKTKNGFGVVVKNSIVESSVAIDDLNDSDYFKKLNENLSSKNYRKALDFVKADNKNNIKLRKWKLKENSKNLENPNVGQSNSSKTTKNINRISGENRELTAIEVSKETYPNGTDTVIIANRETFSDTISASPLAKNERAAILYTSKDEISKDTLNEIKRLKAKNVIIIGGENSIKVEVLDKLKNNKYSV